MSHADFTVTVVALDEGSHGELAAKFIVDAENTKRAAEEPPVALLPVTPFATLVASYLTVLEATLDRAHDSYITQQANKEAADEELNKRWVEGGEAERAAALAALPAIPEEIIVHDGEGE